MSDNCDTALTEIYEFLDGELDDTARARIEVHLRECSPCLEAFDFETQLRHVLATRCKDKVPDELRSRIQAALDAGTFST